MKKILLIIPAFILLLNSCKQHNINLLCDNNYLKKDGMNVEDCACKKGNIVGTGDKDNGYNCDKSIADDESYGYSYMMISCDESVNENIDKGLLRITLAGLGTFDINHAIWTDLSDNYFVNKLIFGEISDGRGGVIKSNIKVGVFAKYVSPISSSQLVTGTRIDLRPMGQEYGFSRKNEGLILMFTSNAVGEGFDNFELGFTAPGDDTTMNIVRTAPIIIYH